MTDDQRPRSGSRWEPTSGEPDPTADPDRGPGGSAGDRRVDDALTSRISTGHGGAHPQWHVTPPDALAYAPLGATQPRRRNRRRAGLLAAAAAGLLAVGGAGGCAVGTSA